MSALPRPLRACPMPSSQPLHLAGADREEQRSNLVTPRSIDPAAFSDLRRKRTGAEVERIVSLAQWLPPSDRALVLTMFQDHRTAVEAAALTAQPPRQVRKRLRAILARLRDPAFELVVRCRERWPATRRRVGTAVFLHGRSQRDAATHLQISFHTVRSETQLIRALASEPMPRRAPLTPEHERTRTACATVLAPDRSQSRSALVAP